MTCGAGRTALCGRRAEVSGNDLPVVAVQGGGGQMQDDAPHGRFQPGAKSHQVFAQGADARQEIQCWNWLPVWL